MVDNLSENAQYSQMLRPCQEEWTENNYEISNGKVYLKELSNPAYYMPVKLKFATAERALEGKQMKWIFW